MARNLFVLHDVTDFAPGAFENVAVGEGSIQLGRSGSEYLASGCYTSPAFTMEPFTTLVPSWNVDTPPGTAVEAQARVSVSGRWSRWFSFGRWSPFISRASSQPQRDEIAVNDGESLRLAKEDAPAGTAQVRMFLYTNDPAQTPHLRLLSVATQPVVPPAESPGRTDRMLEIPRYSCLVRDPSIAERIATPTALAMLMNRWGEDVLPEEVARAMYDTVTGRFGNPAYVAAAAGMYGYECYAQYSGMDTLRLEVKNGRAAAAQVHYRAPALTEMPGIEPDDPHLALPVLEDAAADSFGHLVVVRGFLPGGEGESEQVLLHDPMANDNAGVEKRLPLEKFLEIYTGLCYLFRRGPKGAGLAKPVRVLTQLEVEGGTLHLSAHGEVLQPGRTIPGDTSRATICYTLSDGTVYASAAQKKFYYVKPDENGGIHIDAAAAAGKKLTIYLIGSRGATWVAEKEVPAAPQEKEETPHDA